MIPPAKTSRWHEVLGDEVMRAWIADANARAVMTYTDQIGYGVMRAWAANGTSTCHARSPSLAAIDEASSRHMQPALRVSPSPVDLGYAAADMLISMISGKDAMPSLRLLPMRLIERASFGGDVHDDG